jgi:hypothetical protein
LHRSDCGASRKILGWAALAIVVLLVGSELTLRFAFGLGRPLLYTADAQVGYLPSPNQDIRRFGATIHINQFGMRSDDLPRSRVEPGIRLLFIGDSVTFGTTRVDQDRIFTELIKTRMRSRSGRKVEIMNVSAGGWAPENEYRYLESRGTFNADVVLLVINTNDLDQPFAVLEKSLQFPTSNPTSAIEELWSRYLEPRVKPSASLIDPGSVAESLPDAERNERVLSALESAREYSESHGAHFAIIYSPSTFAIERTAPWKAIIQKFMDWTILKRIKLINMSSAYSKYQRDAVYLDDIHLRPFGHALVATEFMNHYDDIAVTR